MGSIGTFGSFTQARLGIYASHAGLSVTGNNIANINTTGYTRQSLGQASFYSGGADRYYTNYDIHVGNGVLCEGVSQLRDPYLDIRYRSEMATVGAMDAKLAGLEEIARIIDEVGDGEESFGIIANQLNDLLNQLAQISDQTGQAEYDLQVRSSAEKLTNQLRFYAAQLEHTRVNADTSFKEDLREANVVLNNIRDLNSAIRKAEIHGDNALELRDERNLLIDQLSAFMKVDVHYSQEDIGGGTMVEKLTITLANGKPIPDTLVDGIYSAQLSIREDEDGTLNDHYLMDLSALTDVEGRLKYTIEKGPLSKIGVEEYLDNRPSTVVGPDENGIIHISTYTAQGEDYFKQDYTKYPSVGVKLGDNDLYGSLQAQRENLTESGEFSTPEDLNIDPGATAKRGIPYFQKSLDLFARKIAKVFNDANQGYLRNEKGNYITADDKEITLAGEPLNVTGLTDAQAAKLAEQGKTLEDILEQHGVAHGCPLFSNRDDTDDDSDITASNITISKTWSLGQSLVNSFVKPAGMEIASTDSSNLLHMMAMLSDDLNFVPSDLVDGASSTPMFYGDLSEMWVNMSSILGNDIDETSTVLDTYYASANQLDSSRMAVSSVDLNDEAMNLMQYSKSYNAACRLMTTLDSVLDKLINGTGTIT